MEDNIEFSLWLLQSDPLRDNQSEIAALIEKVPEGTKESNPWLKPGIIDLTEIRESAGRHDTSDGYKGLVIRFVSGGSY